MRTVFLLLILVLSFDAKLAVAQGTVAMLRIDEVPYAPQIRRVSPCGVTLGLDPTWELTSEKKEIQGTLYDVTRSRYSREVASARFNHPMMRFTVPPLATATVYCARGSWPPGDAERRAMRVAENHRNKGSKHVESRRFVIGGQEWFAVQYQANEKGKHRMSHMNLYANKGDMLMRVRFSATTGGCRSIAGILPGGEVHTVTAKDGTKHQARYGGSRGLTKAGAVCSSRTHRENKALFTEMRRTIR